MWGVFNLSHARWLPYWHLKFLYQTGVQTWPANSLFLPPVARVENLICFTNKLTCNHVSWSTLSTRYSYIPLLYLIKRGACANCSCTEKLLQKDFPGAEVSQLFCFLNGSTFIWMVIYFKWDYFYLVEHWSQPFQCSIQNLNRSTINGNKFINF